MRHGGALIHKVGKFVKVNHGYGILIMTTTAIFVTVNLQMAKTKCRWNVFESRF